MIIERQVPNSILARSNLWWGANEGPRPIPIGDNSKNYIADFINLLKKKNQTIGPIKPNWHKASLDKGSCSFSKDGPRPFTRGDNFGIVKIHG